MLGRRLNPRPDKRPRQVPDGIGNPRVVLTEVKGPRPKGRASGGSLRIDPAEGSHTPAATATGCPVKATGLGAFGLA